MNALLRSPYYPFLRVGLIMAAGVAILVTGFAFGALVMGLGNNYEPPD
jgi:hypothetical protein